MKISIDLDGVIFNMDWLFQQIHSFNNEEYHYPVTWKMDNFSEKIRYDIFDAFRSPDTMYHVPFLFSSISIGNFFYNLIIDGGNELYIVSSRYKEIHTMTKEILLKEFPMLKKDNIYIIEGSKIPVLKELNIDLHIDDSPEVIESCLEKKIDCIMVSNETTVYNHYLRDRVKWIDNIFDIKYLLF